MGEAAPSALGDDEGLAVCHLGAPQTGSRESQRIGEANLTQMLLVGILLTLRSYRFLFSSEPSGEQETEWNSPPAAPRVQQAAPCEGGGGEGSYEAGRRRVPLEAPRWSWPERTLTRPRVHGSLAKEDWPGFHSPRRLGSPKCLPTDSRQTPQALAPAERCGRVRGGGTVGGAVRVR